MNPLTFLTGLALFALPLLAAARPNVIVILADDVGWGDPGSYGATKIKTPEPRRARP